MQQNHDRKRLISDAIFIVSVKQGDKSIPLYITENDSGHEADVATDFITSHGLNNSIKNNLIGVIKQRLDLHFKRKETALFFLDFTTPSGTKSIFINSDDDIDQVAADFVEKQELPKSAVEKLTTIIKEKKDFVLKQQRDAIKQETNKNDNDIKEHENIDTKKTANGQHEKHQEKQYEKQHENHKNKEANPSTTLTVDTGNNSEPAPSRFVKPVVFTPNFVSSFKDTDNKLAPNTVNQIDTKDTKKNENAFDRLYNAALSLRRSQEQLKKKMEHERKSNLLSTSFKYSVGHTKNSPSRRVRSHSVDSVSRRGRKVVDDDGVLNRRPLSVCRAIRVEQPPSPAVHNQESFDRLYESAHHQAVTKQTLKIQGEMERRKNLELSSFKSSVGHLINSPSNRIPKSTQSVFDRLSIDAESKRAYIERLKEITDHERQVSVQSTTFKESIGFVSYSPSLRVHKAQLVENGSFHENLYERDMQWLKKRNKSIADIGNGIRKKKDEEELREIRDKPELFTSPHTHRPNSKSMDELFSNLHDYADEQREHHSRLWISYELERVKDFNSPMLVAPKSHEMAKKVRSERMERKLNPSIYRDDYSNPYINNDNLVAADFTSPFTLDKLGDSRLETMAEAVEATQDNKFVNPESNNSSPTTTKEVDQVSNITSGSSKTGSGSRKNKKAGAFSLKTSTILSHNIVEDGSIIFGTFGESPVPMGGSSQNQTPKTGIIDTVSEGHDDFVESVKSNSSTASIFYQLYEDRHTSAERRQSSIKKYRPTFNFSPVLHTNNHINNKMEDNKRRELTKDEFYQKMHNYREEHEKLINGNAEKMYEEEMSRNISYNVKLDESDEKRLISRLTTYYPERHNNEIDRMREKSKVSNEVILSATKKSNELATKARRNSLNKLFDALLMSVEIVVESKKGKKDYSESLSETKEGDGEQLNVKLAILEALECPPNLHNAVRKVLSNATDFLSRAQFIQKIESLMKCGVTEPFSATLTAPNRSKVAIESSENLSIKCCKEKPDLFAKKTDTLASQKRPLPGQAIEDHLLSYDDIYERSKSKMREDMESEESKGCTFQPILYSKYTYKSKKGNDSNSPQKIDNNNNIQV